MGGCGSYKITVISLVSITGNHHFSFSGPFYALGTFTSQTEVSGNLGLNNYYISGCGYITLPTTTWSASWVDSSQPMSVATDQLYTAETLTVPHEAYTVTPSK